MRRLVWMVSILAMVTVGSACSKKQPATAPTGDAAARTTDVAPRPDGGDAGMGAAGAVDPGATRAAAELGPVYFDFDRYDLREDARAQLGKNAQYLAANAVSVVIEGHCDEFGTNEYNLALGERRARAAADYLVSLGVDASRLRTVSYGEERPFCHDGSKSCWQLNRRAHFMVAASTQG